MTEGGMKNEQVLKPISEQTRKLQTLLIRHQNEWNENLCLEMKSRQVLDEQHKRERDKLPLDEINVHERNMLEAKQAQEVKELVNQNNKIRIVLRQRHLRDLDMLNRLYGK